MTTTRALLLDLDNTLLDRQAAVRAYLHAWATVSGAVDVEGFVNKALHIDRSGYTSREAFLGRKLRFRPTTPKTLRARGSLVTLASASARAYRR